MDVYTTGVPNHSWMKNGRCHLNPIGMSDFVFNSPWWNHPTRNGIFIIFHYGIVMSVTLYHPRKQKQNSLHKRYPPQVHAIPEHCFLHRDVIKISYPCEKKHGGQDDEIPVSRVVGMHPIEPCVRLVISECMKVFSVVNCPCGNVV